MEIQTVEEALQILGEASIDARTQEAAYQFLQQLDPQQEVPKLVEALRSEHFKVRWAAAKRLSDIGLPALKGILNVLVDPQKVGDQRLRDGVYHVLHDNSDPYVREVTWQLLQDLHGSAADLRTMQEANRLLQEMPGSARNTNGR